MRKIETNREGEDFYWASEDADSGYSPAQEHLGDMYQSGIGVEKNDAISFQWYLLAAERGSADAAAAIGSKYKKGQGTDRDEKKALDWIMVGVQRNSSLAHRILAGVYATGQLGQPRDMNKMKEHNLKANMLIQEKMAAGVLVPYLSK